MHFISSVICAAALCASTAFAAPTQTTNCPLGVIAQPVDQANATNRLPAASGKLVHVALGVGTQNYTCINGVPSSIGASAVLYDASCLATQNMQLLLQAPNLALSTPPDAQAQLVRMFSQVAKQQYTLGYHFFRDTTTPTFVLNTGELFVGAVDVKMPAPAYSSKGLEPNEAFGSVPWLKLKTKGTDSKGLTGMFRLVTAGGNPPPTCTGPVQIDYAALYWAYN